jgi:hypothetical protein
MDIRCVTAEDDTARPSRRGEIAGGPRGDIDVIEPLPAPIWTFSKVGVVDGEASLTPRTHRADSSRAGRNVTPARSIACAVRRRASSCSTCWTRHGASRPTDGTR